jgi:hypothetical protein
MEQQDLNQSKARMVLLNGAGILRTAKPKTGNGLTTDFADDTDPQRLGRMTPITLIGKGGITIRPSRLISSGGLGLVAW